MNKTLKANHEFFYGGKTLGVGEEFLAADPDARILCVLGKATEVTESVAPAPVETAQMKAEEPAAEAGDTETRPKRYRRRDMRAEE